jgi:hypothetical protein
MNITGSGTGTLSYEINDEQAVQDRDCSVSGAEDDEAGSLVLSVSFDDQTHGAVIVGITVSGFSTSVSTYDDVSMLTVLAEIVSIGTWVSEDTSSVRLYVDVAEGRDSCAYAGTFSAGNLAWQGSGNQDALAIKFGTFSVTMDAQEVT